jgi:hypothetical protein
VTELQTPTPSPSPTPTPTPLIPTSVISSISTQGIPGRPLKPIPTTGI